MEAKKQRLNVEKKIKNDFFNVKIGTVNRLNPQVIYYEVRTFVAPLEEYDNYSFVFAFLRKELSRTLTEKLKNNEYFTNKFILDFQVANSGVRVNKKSFLTFQLFLRQKEDSIVDLKSIKKLSEPFISELLEGLKENIIKSNFLIAKTKKESIYIS
jgi:hypothetical protein